MKTAGGFQDISPSINHPYGQPPMSTGTFFIVFSRSRAFNLFRFRRLDGLNSRNLLNIPD
jgi:hypothetical protein